MRDEGGVPREIVDFSGNGGRNVRHPWQVVCYKARDETGELLWGDRKDNDDCLSGFHGSRFLDRLCL